MVLDSDDLYLPDETASLFRRFQTESAPWAAGRVVDIDEHGSHLWSGPFIDLDDGWTDLDCVRTHAATFGYAPFHCSATIARREVLEAVGGWDESATFVRSEDVAMWARVARDHRGWFSHRPVLNYRRHDGSITKASLWREGHPGMTVLDLIDTPAESRGFTADLKAHR
jgi:GT2 family glycosyltransferase